MARVLKISWGAYCSKTDKSFSSMMLRLLKGPAGEHSTVVMGEGKNPTKDHLLQLAAVGNIKKGKALEILDQVLEAIQKWKIFAERSGVSTLQTKNIAEALDHISRNLTSS